MSTSFRTTFEVEATPEQTFDAICDVRGWWSGEIEGRTDTLGEEFDYTVPGIHFSRQRVVELDRATRVAWLIVDSRLDYLEDQAEWTGSTVTFELEARGSGTQLSFSHQGLVPEQECYSACSSAWSSIVLDDLRRRIASGARELSQP